jgi:pimeloyl-ACP methyl ester carboxylesterase
MNHERSGSGPPLIAIHGLGSNLRVWDRTRERLGAKHELIAVDLPGFGDSRPAVGHPGVCPLVDALEAWLGEQGLDRPHVVGNSMGGRIALELAARGRAASVVAISPAGFNSATENVLVQSNLGLQRIITRLVAPVAPTLLATPGGRIPLLGPAVARPWQLTAEEGTSIVRGYARATGWRRAFHDVVWGRPEGLERITCPVTVLWGTRDLILPVSGAGRVRERLPAARVECLEGLGHFPMLDDPARVASAVLEATGGST